MMRVKSFPPALFNSFLPTILLSSVILSCGKTVPSSLKDIGGVDVERAVVMHYNSSENSYEVWHCPKHMVVRSFSDCSADGEKFREYDGESFTKTVVRLLRDNEQHITTKNHRAWVNTAAEAILNDEMPEIEAEQARLRIEIDKIT